MFKAGIIHFNARHSTIDCTVRTLARDGAGLDVINAHERDPKIYLEGMKAAVNAVSKGELDPTPLYTHRFGLDGISDAFTSMQQRPNAFLKGLVTL